jgi:hydrogenase nickel incorporation protein HypA/HybF
VRVHELSICGSIADIVSRRAADRRVETIHLRVGQLRQVVPDTLAFCWTMVSADTTLDGSVLDIEHIPARLECRDCGAMTELDYVPILVCSACTSTATTVVSGEEFLITALDLADA